MPSGVWTANLTLTAGRELRQARAPWLSRSPTRSRVFSLGFLRVSASLMAAVRSALSVAGICGATSELFEAVGLDLSARMRITFKLGTNRPSKPPATVPAGYQLLRAKQQYCFFFRASQAFQA